LGKSSSPPAIEGAFDLLYAVVLANERDSFQDKDQIRKEQNMSSFFSSMRKRG